MLPVLSVPIRAITRGNRLACVSAAVVAACMAVGLPAWAASADSRAGAWDKYLELRRLGVPSDAMTVTRQPVDRPGGGKAWAVVLRLDGTNWLLFADQPQRALSPLQPPAPPRSAAVLLDGPAAQSSPFGWRQSPWSGEREFHHGIDLAAPEGVPVRAVDWGVVSHAGPAGTYGNLVEVEHSDGLITRYGHLSRVDVQTGDRVSPHTLLGRVGSTGKSTAPHLHFETRYGDRAVDPHEVFRGMAKMAMKADILAVKKTRPMDR